MEKPFQVNILTPEKKVFAGEITSLVVPAELGYLGILANHASIVARLKPGKIIFRENSGAQTVVYNQGQGFLEAGDNKAVILLDSV